MADRVDVDAAGGDVRRHKGAHLAGLEIGEGAFPLALTLVPVDGGRFDADLLEVFRHPVRAVLGAGENDGAAEGRIIELLRQKRALLAGLDEDDPLVHALDGRRLGRDLDPHGIGQEFGGELGDLRRHGRREEHVLPFLGDMADDLADRAEEAKVQHLVGFVQHEDLGVAELRGPLTEVVDQAAGGGDQHINAAHKRLDLRGHLGAAEHGGDADLLLLAIGAEAFGDLGCEFPGRGQDEDAAAATRRGLGVFGQTMQDRQGEGGGLAGAGLGHAQKVAAFHRRGDRLRLDRRGRHIALGAERVQQRLRET